MNYPINVDEYIDTSRRFYSVTERDEQLHRRYYIPLVNEAYQSGRDGSEVYPLDFAEVMAFVEKRHQITACRRQRIGALIDWCNAAYAQGQRDARRVLS